MWHIGGFAACLALCLAFTVWRGGAAEKIAAGSQAVAFIATLVVNFSTHHSYAAVRYDLWLIDAALLGALLALALTSTRFWPMWISSIHLLGVLAHFVRAIDVQMLPEGYYALVNLAGWPMISVTALGVLRHWLRLQRYGSDPSFPFKPAANISLKRDVGE